MNDYKKEDLIKAAELLNAYCDDTHCHECMLAIHGDGCIFFDLPPGDWNMRMLKKIKKGEQ